ncbi:MAG: TIGR04076 family protein [Candidatus Thermoplasmatota archaeon]
MAMEFVVRVKDVKGICPVFHVGDSFRLVDGYRLDSEIPLCMHALSAIMPFYNALRFCSPKDLGLGKADRAYIQCPDPAHCTDGGTVVFEIIRRDNER